MTTQGGTSSEHTVGTTGPTVPTRPNRPTEPATPAARPASPAGAAAVVDDLPEADQAARTIEAQVALLLRLADTNRRRSPLLDGTLERSAYLALQHLSQHGPSGINEIADHLRLDGSTVTRQVVALEQAGLVTRGRDDQDGRRAVISPTDEGLRALAETRDRRARVYAELLDDWTAAERTVLAASLSRLNAALDRSAGRRDA
jgi:DNA-binding MarR family transcriptional regulator